MVVLNKLDRFSLMLNAVKRIPRLAQRLGDIENVYWTAMERHKLHISEHGEDLPEIKGWRWAPG
jgi:xylulose-5-phosphate/fructose-6-phosphate phosphoketolase